MNIAQVVCVYPPYRGGIGQVAADNYTFLKNRGHQVTVFTPWQKSENRKKGLDIKYLRPLFRFGNAALMPSLFWKLAKYDLIYLHYPFFGSAEIVFFLKLILRKRIKLVIHYHMDSPELGFPKNIFSLPSALIKKKLFTLSNLVICASLDYIKSSQINNIYIKYPEKFCEIPFSVDSEKYLPKKIEKEIILITFVGGMDKAHNFKGIDVLLKAFAMINRSDLHLHLVGNGSLIDEYKELSKILEIDTRVLFFPNLDNDEKIVQYQNSDIFVLPSINRHEAFGIVLLEAMSCGIPVIASDLPGVRTVFTDAKEGYLFEPKNELELKNKLEKLISNSSKRKEMGEKARQLVLAKYAKTIVESKLDQALTKLN